MKYFKTDNGNTLHCYRAAGKLITTTNHGEAVVEFKTDDERAEVLQVLAKHTHEQINEDEYTAVRNAMNNNRRVGDVPQMRGER